MIIKLLAYIYSKMFSVIMPIFEEEIDLFTNFLFSKKMGVKENYNRTQFCFFIFLQPEGFSKGS